MVVRYHQVPNRELLVHYLDVVQDILIVLQEDAAERHVDNHVFNLIRSNSFVRVVHGWSSHIMGNTSFIKINLRKYVKLIIGEIVVFNYGTCINRINIFCK